MSMRQHVRRLAVLALMMAAVSAPAAGQLKREKPRVPDPDAGRTVAERLCSSCHVVGTAADTAPVPAGIPSFSAIARRQGQTAATIAGAIVVPHPPMPDTALTRDEIADVAAYILSLGK